MAQASTCEPDSAPLQIHKVRSAHKDNRVLRCLPHAHDLGHDERLHAVMLLRERLSRRQRRRLVVAGRRGYDGGVEERGVDGGVDEVGRESQVGRASGGESDAEDSVDLAAGSGGAVEEGLGGSDARCAGLEDGEFCVRG